MAPVHVVGAGLAGLACAVKLQRAGVPVVVWEAAGHAGGRCRSFLDPVLDCVIDNGTHLVLSGNRSVRAYADLIGAADSLIEGEAAFPFMDVQKGHRWTVRPGLGQLGKLGTVARLGLVVGLAGADKTVADAIGRDPRFWDPFTLAVMNAGPDEASAKLLWAVVRRTLLAGPSACRPLWAKDGLSASFVDPALARLTDVRFHQRLQGVQTSNDAVAALRFGDHSEPVSGDVVLAVPPWQAARLLPGVVAGWETRAIANVHFRLDVPCADRSFTGIVGGHAHWVKAQGRLASVTVSAAPTVDAAAAWADVARVLGREGAAMPAHRVVVEKRASVLQDPAFAVNRPGAATSFRNLFLAGDWTDTGLPATLEGTVQSGFAAADAILRR